jgi:hypothetical protein
VTWLAVRVSNVQESDCKSQHCSNHVQFPSMDSVAAIVSHIDDAIQYHEAQEPREPKDEVEVNYGVALGDVVGREGLECAGI